MSQVLVFSQQLSYPPLGNVIVGYSTQQPPPPGVAFVYYDQTGTPLRPFIPNSAPGSCQQIDRVPDTGDLVVLDWYSQRVSWIHTATMGYPYAQTTFPATPFLQSSLQPGKAAQAMAVSHDGGTVYVIAVLQGTGNPTYSGLLWRVTQAGVTGSWALLTGYVKTTGVSRRYDPHILGLKYDSSKLYIPPPQSIDPDDGQLSSNLSEWDPSSATVPNSLWFSPGASHGLCNGNLIALSNGTFVYVYGPTMPTGSTINAVLLNANGTLNTTILSVSAQAGPINIARGLTESSFWWCYETGGPNTLNFQEIAVSGGAVLNQFQTPVTAPFQSPFAVVDRANLPAAGGQALAVVGGFVPVCTNNTGQINGSNFQPGASITIKDYNGNLVPFTVISFTTTQIIVQFTFTPTSTYCVTVTNPF